MALTPIVPVALVTATPDTRVTLTPVVLKYRVTLVQV